MNEITADQQLRIQAVQISAKVFLSLLEYFEDPEINDELDSGIVETAQVIYDFIKGEGK